MLLCVALLAMTPLAAQAEPVAVHHIEGTLRGFLALRSADGKLLAVGDLIQTVRGNRVTDRLTFHFADGSLDDETTVFSQSGTFRLITDRHIQKGSFFPHPMDMLIDARSGQVTVRTTGKDGKEEVKTAHLNLPPDLVNGMLSPVVRNLAPQKTQAQVSMVVATPKPRIVRLYISARGEDPLTLLGTERKALHYDIRIDLGGIAGVVASLVGKQPPDIQLWIIGGDAPTFIRSQGILFVDGPMLTIEQTVPMWPR